ncbi:Panacea domain-containing protein [Devosia alba]|uniref:Panacea domain-containing protein n=1 Tax=Devosia alba TaxID=3152360 RepID=UPI00326325E9
MPNFGYKTRKAAQVAAFFALKQGGSINVLKLAKLLYIGDREHLSRHDLPILFDNFVSMDHGPVTSTTLDYVNGYQEDRANWDVFVSDRAGYNVGVAKSSLTTDDLDELSDAELDTLEAVWSDFGGMDRYAVRDWTHTHCGEWEDPKGSSAAIPYERVLKFLGKGHTAEIANEIETVRSLDQALSYAQ